MAFIGPRANNMWNSNLYKLQSVCKALWDFPSFPHVLCTKQFSVYPEEKTPSRTFQR